jgi:hypothetical protein
MAAVAAQVAALAPPPTPIRVFNACFAVTRTDVAVALGRSVSKPEEETSTNASTCDYTGNHGRVTISLQRLEREPDIAAEIAALQREIAGASARPAAAFGPKAFFLDIPDGGTQLHVIRGRDYLMVSVLGFGDAPVVSRAVETMARAALSRW